MSRYSFAPSPLSDGLVGHVLPRAPTGRHQSNTTAPFQAAVSPFTTVDGPHAPYHDQYSTAGDTLLSLIGDASDRPTSLRAGGRTHPRTVSDEMKSSIENLSDSHKRKRVNDGKSRRRAQCRANQARYRDKQRNAQLQLEKNVEQLHKGLDSLKRKYRDLSSRERSNQSPWLIVAEVFRLLESSFRAPWRIVNPHEMTKHTETRQILATLERTFAHDAAMGELSGASALMEQIRLYSQSFGTPHLQLQRIETVAPGVMAARAKLSITVTEGTLRNVFPHLEEPAGGKYGIDGRGLLYQRLLGQRLDCNCSVVFLFDEDSDRVVRLETSIDLTTPLLRLLGHLEDVADVLEHAQICSECVVGDHTEVWTVVAVTALRRIN